MFRKAFYAFANSRSGFTLTELLVAAALTGVVLVTVIGVLFAAQRSAKNSLRLTEQTMAVRVAINQVGDDLSYLNWGFSCQGVPCPVQPAPTQCPLGSQQVSFLAYQPIPGTPPAGGWQYPGFPGYLAGVPLLDLRYQLNGSTLTREVYDELGGLTFSTQQLATGVKPCEPGLAAGSAITYSQSLLSVRLQANDGLSGGGSGAGSMSTGAWFIR